MPRDESDVLLPIGLAARHIHVSVETLRRWSDAGKIRTVVTEGGHRRFWRSDLEMYMASRTTGPEVAAS